MKPIAITLGDPAGVGAEIVLKALATLDIPATLFGSSKDARASGPLPPNRTFVGVGGDDTTLRFGIVDAAYGRVALASIDAALQSIERGECSALVTAPIHKQA